MRISARSVIFLVFGLGSISLNAREIHVRGDAQAGIQNGGVEAPYTSINAAIKNAGAGDTILVHPVAGGYRETVNLYGIKGGAPGNPMTIDGQGSELIGSDPVSADGWEFDAQNEVYKRNDIQVGRGFFFIVDGEMIFESKTTRENLKPGAWCGGDGAVYFKPPAGKSMDELAMGMCTRVNGVQINGDTSHVIIRNFTTRYFSNDGYNIHGKARALEFYNCNARDMGDEGFSAHGEAETLLDGAVYENCENGIFNANTGGKTIARNIIVKTPRAIGFGFSPRDGSAEHVLENAVLMDCPTALRVGGKSRVSNVLVISNLAKQSTAINMDGGASFKDVAISGESVVPLRMHGSGPFQFSHVTFNTPQPIYFRSEKAWDEVVQFEASAFPYGLKIGGGAAFEALSRTGTGNREFEKVSNMEFLEALQEGKFPGPTSELVAKAMKLLAETNF